MNVTGYSTDDRSEWTTPYPRDVIGLKVRVLRGDVMFPDLSDAVLRPGKTEVNWFNAIPLRVSRYVVGWRPFVSLGAGVFGVYAGWKVYGVDSKEYIDYPGVTRDDVYDGSLAMVPTIRFTRKRDYR